MYDAGEKHEIYAGNKHPLTINIDETPTLDCCVEKSLMWRREPSNQAILGDCSNVLLNSISRLNFTEIIVEWVGVAKLFIVAPN